jgi:hypothetical protein
VTRFEDTLREWKPLPIEKWAGESFVLTYEINQLVRDAIADALAAAREMERTVGSGEAHAAWEKLVKALDRLDALA